MPMREDSFVYGLLGIGVSNICFCVFAHRAAQKKWKTYTMLALLYCIYDLFLFMWCYNREHYYYIPYAVMIWISWKLFKR